MLHKLPSWNNFKEIVIYKQNLTLFWPPTAPAHLLHSLWRGSLGSCTCVCAQLHLTLCNPMNCSPAGSSVHRISQARTLEWVTMPSFRGSLDDIIIKCKCYANSCQQMGTLLCESSWNFFFSIFDPQLVESEDGEHTDRKGWLYRIFNTTW